MKIGIDISAVIYGTGVSVYTKNLVENLVRVDDHNDYLLFGGSLRRKNEISQFLANSDFKNTAKRTYPLPPTLADILWNKLHIFPIEKLVGKMDVFHSSDWTQPPSNAFKVTTVHDLSPVLFPELTDPKVVITHKKRLKWVIKEADRVITPSGTTKNDCEKLGIPKSKIRVIPEAVNPLILPAKRIDIDIIKRRYRIPGRYFLAVGVNARKNTENIIKAFERVKIDIDSKLVIIGHPYSKMNEHKGVIFTGHVSQKELPAFYSGSEALVYPSLYEGFGIPILEAYTCMTPVVTSNIGSMAEVGKDAVMVDPLSSAAIAEGMLKAVKERKQLVDKGLKAVSGYSWLKTAKETLKVYEEALS